ncbi:hypothetical protein GM415_08745 [Pseudodesulfovibrio cashew]|uniref:Uncharacterized protein n=1 Tax=Pseudodesulfovibrio cashew TaxID=2678688 RepID=A0A6I6JDK5_9BACT|nr:DUF6765 family protein [Pseudodesulfovibrio cashew]QGY40211.1 hypothetical protein GM415_08745 [Pseudodesulfovibrio cashew]
MQLDMHFYGTYAVARIAGFTPESALTVATAAQFVDEAVSATPIEVAEQRYMLPVVSAHAMLELGKNFDLMDQWNVWVPFHFLPGGMGDNADERLVCLLGDPGNDAVDEIIRFALKAGAEGKPYALHLLGIVTHVIQDTYSHYGFSGMASALNEVKQDTLTPLNVVRLQDYISRKLDTFFERVAASFAEASKLGHAGAATFPDRPYLKWAFDYAVPGGPDVDYLDAERDNPATFLKACTRLHAVYSAYLDGATRVEQGHLPFEAGVAGEIANILVEEGTKEERCGYWRRQIQAGALFPEVADEDRALVYSAQGWGVRAMLDNPLAVTTDAYQFHRAAGKYLDKVRLDILTALGILLD